MTDTNEAYAPKTWRELMRELWSRTKSPWLHPSFGLYFFTGVVAFAGFGVWAEVKTIVFARGPVDLTNLRIAINVFYPSLGCAAMFQLSWGGTSKVIRSFGQTMACVFVAAFAAMPDDNCHNLLVIPLGIFFSILALWCWCIANATSPEYQDKTDSSTGGDVSAPLKGTMMGFDHD